MAPKAQEKESSTTNRRVARRTDFRPTRLRYGQFPIKRVNKPKQVFVKGQKKEKKSYVVQTNPKLARLRALRDLKIPSIALSGPGANVLRMAGKAAIFAAVAVDTLRVSSALYSDLKEKGKPGKLTVMTGSSVGFGWLGSIGGAAGGHAAGASIGMAVGSFFGGIGMIPGAAIGAMLGIVTGGMLGGLIGSKASEVVVDKLVKDSDEEDNADEDEDENDNYVDFTTDQDKMLKKVDC